MLQLYRRLLALRHKYPELHGGSIHSVADESTLLRFCRGSRGERTFQVLLNLGDEEITTHCEAGHVVLTTLLDGEGASVGGQVTIEAGEGLLILLDEQTS